MHLRSGVGAHDVVIVKTPVAEPPGWEQFRSAGWGILRALGARFDGQTVVIKPNMTCSDALPGPDTGVTTHPGAIEGMACWCRDHGAGSIRIVEHVNSEHVAPGCWGNTGYVQMARDVGAELLGPEITADDCVEMPTPAPVRMLSTNLAPRLLFEPNTVLVNVAKMKTHGVVITLSMKNLQGLVEWNRRRFCAIAGKALGDPRLTSQQTHEAWQRLLTECHVDLIRGLRGAGLPMLHVVEGLVAREGSGFLNHGANRLMGLMVAGLDPVAVDTVCAWCMGFDPQKVVALETAHEAGIGANRLDEIRVLTVQGDALVPVSELGAFAAERPFQTYLGLPELDAGRPYDRGPITVAA